MQKPLVVCVPRLVPFSPTARGVVCRLALNVSWHFLPTGLAGGRFPTLRRGLGTCRLAGWQRTVIHFPLFPSAVCTSQSPSLRQRYRLPVGGFV